MEHAVAPSPIGPLRLEAEDGELMRIVFHSDPGDPPTGGVLREVQSQLDAYFAGELRTFDVPLAMVGTAFERAVWDLLIAIPFGETRSYGDLAYALDKPGAARAVGLANGKNPLPIIVPCHRVIGADGSLTGFGGGVDTKRFLLQHEGSMAQLELFS